MKIELRRSPPHGGCDIDVYADGEHCNPAIHFDEVEDAVKFLEAL